MEARRIATFLFFFVATTVSSSATVTPAATSHFIKDSCSNVTYPDLCYKSLSPNAASINSDSWALFSSALNVSLVYALKAKSTFSTMSKSKILTKAEKAAIKQCRVIMVESIDKMKQSAKIVSGIERARSSSSISTNDMEFEISTLNTRLSGVLTNLEAYKDELQEMAVRVEVKKQILKWEFVVERMTSNALSLLGQATCPRIQRAPIQK